MADSSIVEINRAYYPLIARIALISIALDAVFFVLYLALQNSVQWPLGIWLAIYLVKIIIFLYLVTTAAYRWTGIYYHIDAVCGWNANLRTTEEFYGI